MQWNTWVLLGQTTPAPGRSGLWALFTQSFDLFTILLLAGSLVGVALIVLCALEVRERNIVPADEVSTLAGAAQRTDTAELRNHAGAGDSFVHRVVRAALPYMHGSRSAMRDAAELAASEESARWFRKIDLLNMIGNLGPLIGLAGTVWGMILAFTSLREAGDQARAADLSQGISKALFHTLLGLCLAIPCLIAYGLFKNKVDRLCTRAIIEASGIVEHLPADERERAEDASEASGEHAAIGGEQGQQRGRGKRRRH